jgi:hypothetical protein
LTVDLSEAAGTPLTITATSTADASKSAVATVTVEYAIGDAGPAGGKIFYVDSADTYPLWKYLEAAPADIVGTMMWASSGFTTTPLGGTLEARGTGKDNTATILAQDADAPAAKACDDYSLGVFDDWFLPSVGELNEMYSHRTIIGGFSSDWYWTSSETSANSARSIDFQSAALSSLLKYATRLVRPIRAF